MHSDTVAAAGSGDDSNTQAHATPQSRPDREEGELLLRVCGILPVDEFESFVIAVARALEVRGWIRHDARGSLVRAVGTEDQLVRLVRAIRDQAPPSARIRDMITEAPAADAPAAGDSFVPLLDVPAPHGHAPHPALANVA